MCFCVRVLFVFDITRLPLSLPLPQFAAGFVVEYQRATSTDYGDGTVINEASLGGPATATFSFPLAAFPGPSAALYVTSIPPPGRPALTPFFDYLVRVRAINTAGSGPFSSPAQNRTLPALPGPPTALVGAVQDFALLFNWTLPAPLDRRGIVSEYLFVLTRGPGQPGAREPQLPCPVDFARFSDDACQITLPRVIGSELVSTTAFDLQPFLNFTGQVDVVLSLSV